MRKLVSLGLFALMFSIFSSQVFAGKIAVCEKIKGDPAYKGLYGLCNAYWNAKSEDAREEILANFEKKAGTDPDAPGMPGLGPDPDFFCPCWTEVSFNDVCSLGGTTVAIYGGDFGLAMYKGGDSIDEFYSTDTANCIYSGQFNVGDKLINHLSDGEGLDCRAEIETIATLYASGGCDI